MSQPPSQTPHILIADDDPVFTSLAAACLTKAGYWCSVANDGAVALEVMDQHTFDLVIVDLDMPKIDGFRLIALVRGAAKLRDLGIVVVTSSKQASDLEEAMAIGANAFHLKPVDWRILPMTVQRVLASRSSSQSTQQVDIRPL